MANNYMVSSSAMSASETSHRSERISSKARINSLQKLLKKKEEGSRALNYNIPRGIQPIVPLDNLVDMSFAMFQYSVAAY